ncbi:hypothetical protein [Mycolicibacterium phocaicum]|jgi:hypothetical protein|uniref:hypothetical protein n=1 Tax=Mycolicibacterium phocaicum TaxID=319706 RepID=UPI001CF9DDC9|nr:hypothetical protein [Mycolicibacterium phocaicum]UCZ58727.1 hypothetical protein LHJ73_18305 [Mycolicibacterium phocaicum]
MRPTTFWLIAGSAMLSLVLGLAMMVADDKGMKVIANWVAFGGNTLTFIGLLWAVLRSTGAQQVITARLERWWRLLRYGGISATVHVTAAAAGYGMAGATVNVQHSFSDIDQEVDPVQRLMDRTDRLLQVINFLEDRNTSTQGQLNELERAVVRARADARSDDDKVRAEATEALDRFADEMKRSDVLDLRWAIAGTFFSMLGALLTLCTPV